MAIENMRSTPTGLVTFTDRDRSGFTADVALDPAQIRDILNMLPEDILDGVIAAVEQRRAAAQMLELRKADREERANRRKEMRQELRDSYAR